MFDQYDEEPSKFLTENDVVESVAAHLAKNGWTIVSFCDTWKAGIDIHAARGTQTLYVEAKGITSSKPSSSRYGKRQSASQIFIQVAAALLKCAELRSAYPDAGVAIAAPAHAEMIRRVEMIKPVLEAASISVIWVDTQMAVSCWNAAWEI